MFIPHMQAYSKLLAAINSSPHDYRYRFMDEAEFCALIPKDIRAANAVYVQELLFRAHIAAITTLFRNEKWMLGIDSAFQHPNYYTFAAALRGLVESAADSHHCLIHVPGTLRDHCKPFYIALKGQFDAGVVCCHELEDILIHYSHGRKQPKASTAPASHFAKTSQEYLRSLDGSGCSVVRDLYAELCEITHPAERTVAIFVVRDSSASQDYVIAKDVDRELIADLLRRHASAFPNVFQMSFNAALLSLYALNRFDDPRFYTRGIEKIDMSNIPAFRELKSQMKVA